MKRGGNEPTRKGSGADDGAESVVRGTRENAFEAGNAFLSFFDFAAGSAESRHPTIEAGPLLVEPGGLSLVLTVRADVAVINWQSGPQQAATGRCHRRSSRVSDCVVD